MTLPKIWAGTAYKAVVALLLLWAPMGQGQEPDFVGKIDIPVKGSTSSCAINGKYYTGTYFETTGIVITRTDIATWTTYEAQTLITNSTITKSWTMLCDPDTNKAYIGVDQSPSYLVEFDLTSFTTAGRIITLPFGNVKAGTIDLVNKKLWFGYNSNGAITKVDIASFTVDTTIAAGTTGLAKTYNSIGGPHKGFIYAGDYANNGRIIKINIATNAVVGGPLIASPIGYIFGPIIDPIRDLMYYNTQVSTSNAIVKIDLASFTQVDNLILSTAANSTLKSYTPGIGINYPCFTIGYFGVNEYFPFYVLTVRLETMDIISTDTYNSGQIYSGISYPQSTTGEVFFTGDDYGASPAEAWKYQNEGECPTMAPTMGPTTQPSSAPTLSPTKSPSKAPTKVPTPPTNAPTPSPTAFEPSTASWANIGINQVCEIEIPLTDLQRQRQLEGADNVQAMSFTGSADSCYESCKEQLGVDGFEFNVYQKNGSPVCTCCLNCINKRVVPGAKVYQTCAEDIMLLGRLSPRRAVSAGRTITYKVTVKNPSKTTSWTDLLLTVDLPDGVTYIGSKLSHDKRAQKSTTSSNKNVVTLADLSLRAHQKRTFQVKVRVDADTSAATLLSFSATLSQTAYADAPYCEQSTAASEVIVR